jgi:hypothetical protein
MGVLRSVFEADSDVVSEAQTPHRGRPEVFSEDVLQYASGFSYARQVGTRRGAQDLVYRMFAVAAIEHYCEAFPENAATLSWFFSPRRRHTLLTELGRIGRPRSGANGSLSWSEGDVARLISAALELARDRPTTKAGVAHLRTLRRSP